MQNSPGEDGMSYILLFEAQVLMMSTPLSSFELPFHFYNGMIEHNFIHYCCLFYQYHEKCYATKNLIVLRSVL